VQHATGPWELLADYRMKVDPGGRILAEMDKVLLWQPLIDLIQH
jgi:hypothetical protein